MTASTSSIRTQRFADLTDGTHFHSPRAAVTASWNLRSPFECLVKILSVQNVISG